MRFDLTDLRLFLAVVDAGSITGGAAEAGLSLAAASERLRDMELDGAVSLLERGRRGVKPTPAGEALAHHARRVLRQMAEMRGELAAHARGLRTVVRMAANTAAISEFLPARLAPWLAAEPQIDIDLKERQSSEIARLVTGGLADIGILSAAVDTAGLDLRPFAADRLVLVVPAGHRLATAKSIALVEVLDQPFIGLGSGALQAHVEAQAQRLGSRLKLRLRLATYEGVCRLVAEGAGLAILSEAAARRCARGLKLVILRLSDGWATRQLSLAKASDSDLPAPARALFDYLAGDTGA
ncbi:LysR family transcriptional regulator [Radicibacter daui]|uniref:LysR family transcriptional regulator n=1 Tax=Radicibacter daui TaxID=3064829 RepID=UPI004046E6BA